MPIDREETLKKAEKLLRQGRLDLAIAEYQRVVDEFPRDWNTANTLGDCFYRAHQAERAVEQYNRIADHFALEGFFPKAAALYKKSLKIKPDDAHALLRAAEIAIQAGTLAEAKQYLATLAERRRALGDAAGAAEALTRIGALDPDDLDARLSAARAVAASGGTTAGAEFRAIAEAFAAMGQQDRGIGVLVEAAGLVPGDETVRGALVEHYGAQGDVEHALEYAVSVNELTSLADALEAKGDRARALVVLEKAATARASRGLAERLVRGYAAEGDHERARAHLDALGDINETGLLRVAAELRAGAGEHEASGGLFARLLAREPHLAHEIAARGAELAATSPEAALVHVESAAETMLLHGDFTAAAGAYQSFLRHQPRHVMASLRLVEICVDGELADLPAAQAALIDAYLAAGRGAEARAVAEDLVTTHSDDAANVERLRQALIQTGEADVEGVIAERLSASALAATEDYGMDLSEEPTIPAAVEPSGPALRASAPDDATPAAGGAEPSERSNRRDPRVSGVDPFRLSPIAIDLDDILGDEFGADSRDTSAANPEVAEVDLSDALAGLKGASSAPPVVPPRRTEPAARPVPDTLDGVFADFREEVARHTQADAAEQHFKVGLTYEEMGMVSEAIKELEIAVRAPRLRFDAASRLARLSLKRGNPLDAIEWFERAAEAPAPTAEAGRTLLYELGDTLEAGGETARALAVFLELQADAADFRDVERRVERLTRAQAGS